MPDDSLPYGEIIMGLLGGLALFLFGMDQMTVALKAVAGRGMKRLLGSLTKNRFLGVITGAVVTAVIQSSSVTTVLVVGFVTAGLMSLTPSVGVIMGANVGTTVTAQIVAFKVTKYALILVFVGFLMLFVGRRDRLRQWGAMIMGLGLIFFGMGLMSDATSDLRNHEPFIETMQRMDNPFLGMLVAALFTALVQSSSATTGIVIVLATQGFISLEAGIALAFGSNVGTCATALLATLGKARPAMRAATVHVLFNVVGVLIWLPLIDPLASVVRDVSPSYPELQEMKRLAAETPRQIANAHTLFNVANVLIFLPFAGLIATLTLKLVPDKPKVVSPRATPKYLKEVFLETPSLALEPLRLEICRFGRLVEEFADETVAAVRAGKPLDDLRELHRDIGLLYQSILGYLQRLTAAETDARILRRAGALGSVLSNVEHISAVFATGLANLVKQRAQQEIEDDPEASEILIGFHDKVRAAEVEALTALEEGEEGVERARRIVDLKPLINAAAADARSRLSRRIDPDDEKSLARFRLQMAVVDLLQRRYYYSKKIAKEIVGEVEESRRDDPDVAETIGSGIPRPVA